MICNVLSPGATLRALLHYHFGLVAGFLMPATGPAKRMKSNARRADLILRDAPGAAALIARLEASLDAARVISALCAQVLPGFDVQRPGTCELRSGTLRITLPSAAHCAKLRQAAPRLISLLRRQGFEVNEIATSVQPELPGHSRDLPAMAGSRRDAISSLDSGRARSDLSAAQAFASKLAQTIGESPLQRAALSMAAACARRLARIRE